MIHDRRAADLRSCTICHLPFLIRHLPFWCANLDRDKDEELIIGQRDPNSPATPGARGPGVFVFDPRPGTYPPVFDRITVDDGGMACEDALAADLDGDGRSDIIAGGRATHNVKIYWNRPQ
ncbi:MAG: hypothetical protein ABSH35_23640 [Isosphaeraceae bacterium]|jgi:hypothetical protein